jgi:arylsulfatase A
MNCIDRWMYPDKMLRNQGPAMIRRRLLLAALAVAPLVLPAPARASERPNVVLILVDDMGWADLACQGSRYFETPAIDRLAAQGIRFTNGYAACAVCSPTRAAIQTGRYPARLGITDWIRARFQRDGGATPDANPVDFVGGPARRLLCPPNPFWLEHEEVTIAEALKPAGYVSAHIGKWHLGDDAWYPKSQGYDVNIGGCDYGQPPSYFDPFANKALKGIPFLPPRKEGEYLTDREADEAARFIREHKDRPFFINLCHYAVHTPLMGKPGLVEKYKAKPPTQQKNAVYAAMVQGVDESAARVMAALEEAGVADRTLVIFTSDNGGLLGSTSNVPLRSGKGYPYEGGIRVPLIVRWPGVIPAGTTSDASAISVDFLPTILEAAGTPLPAGRAIDGVSLLAHLKSGGKVPLDREALFWHFPHYRGNDNTPYSIVRAGDWKLIRRHEGPAFELFNLKEDPSETKDLAEAQPDRVKALDALLMAHLKDVGAKLPRPNPDYKPGGKAGKPN